MSEGRQSQFVRLSDLPIVEPAAGHYIEVLDPDDRSDASTGSNRRVRLGDIIDFADESYLTVEELNEVLAGTPALGTPSSGTLTNCTGLPVGGIVGLGAGVGTALAVALDGTGGLASKSYVDSTAAGLLDLKGSTDCSANPNYPSASKGDTYYVTVAGRIGGASGKQVDIGDVYVASADNAGGAEASVGTSWFVLEHNLVGAALLAGGNAFTGDQTVAGSIKTTGSSAAILIDDRTVSETWNLYATGGLLSVYNFGSDALTVKRNQSTGLMSVAVNTTSHLGTFTVVNNAAGTVGAVIKGATSQTANVIEAQTSAGTANFLVKANGDVGIGPSAAVTTIGGGTSTIDIRNNSGAGFRFGQTGSNHALFYQYAGTIYFDAQPAQPMLFQMGGATILSLATTGAATFSGRITAGSSIVDPTGYVQTSNVYCDSFNDQATTGAYLQLGAGVPVTVQTRSSGNKGLVVKGATSQTANLQEWQNSSGTALTYVTKDGNLVLPTGSPTTPGLAFSGYTNFGFYFDTAPAVTKYAYNNNAYIAFNYTGIYLSGTAAGTNSSGLFWNNASTMSAVGVGTVDTGILRRGPAVIGVTSDSASYGGTFSSTPRTPAQITADQNDYAPGVARFYRLDTDASRTVTGLSVSQVDGQECEVWNVGANNVVLAHQSASSTAANRFICTAGADITLAPDEVALLRYDGTTGRWRVRKV